MNSKGIICLDNIKAKKFFMDEKNYCNVDLPKYFKPIRLLNKISKFLENNTVNSYYSKDLNTNKENYPNDFEQVNYKLFGNKDGELGWRRFELIHPVLYIELVNLITLEENWKVICNRFNNFSKNQVLCASVHTIKNNRKSIKAGQVLQWWENIEQEALKLGLEYSYVYDADIADCYGSIYTHTISKALHGKINARNDRKKADLLGSKIDRCFQSMQYRQTNGIPQGSVISDFVAEIVLGYVDELLCDRIKHIENGDYKILRYRDDYKIFTNRPDIGREILKLLSETLIEMGMRLNNSKTKEGFDPILASVKEDKIDELFIPLKNENYSKWILQIYATVNKHPNSGKAARQLNIYHECLLKRIKEGDKLKKHENPEVIISIVTNLAIKNPKYYNWCAAIISILLEYCSKKDRKIIAEKIVNRFKNVPNTGLLDIWLQRVTFINDPKKEYKEKICNLVRLDKYPGNQEIWNSDWISGELLDIVNKTKIISRGELKKLKPVIDRDETDLFHNILS